MAGNGFKYIIQAEVQLNMSSVNKLLSQVSLIDRQIQQRAGINLNVKLSDSAAKSIQRQVGAINANVSVRLGIEKGSLATLKRDIDLAVQKLQQEVQIQLRSNNQPNAGATAAQPNANSRLRNGLQRITSAPVDADSNRAYRATTARMNATSKAIQVELDGQLVNARISKEMERRLTEQKRRTIVEEQLRTQEARTAREEANRQTAELKRQAQAQRLARVTSLNQPRITAHQEAIGGLESSLRDVNIPMAQKQQNLRTLIEQYRQLAMATGQNLQKSFVIHERNLDGSIAVTRTATREFDRFGEVIDRGERSISAMGKTMGRNIVFYSAVSAAFMQITQGVTASIAAMANFESQYLKIQNITAQRNETAGTQVFNDKDVQGDIFNLGKRYALNPTKDIMPIYTDIIRRGDLAKNADQAKQLTKLVLRAGLATGGNDIQGDDLQRIGQDFTSIYSQMFKEWADGGSADRAIRKMSSFIDALAQMSSSGANIDKSLDAVADLVPFVKGDGRMDLSYLTAIVSTAQHSLGDSSGSELSNILKMMFTNLQKSDGEGSKEARRILGTNTDMSLQQQLLYLSARVKGEDSEGNVVPKMSEGELSEFARQLAGSTGNAGGRNAQFSKVIDVLPEAMDLYKSSLDSQGKAEEMAIKYSKTLRGEWQQLIATMQQLSVNIGDSGLLTGLTNIIRALDAIASALNGVIGMFGKLGDFTKGILGDGIGGAINGGVSTALLGATLFTGGRFAYGKMFGKPGAGGPAGLPLAAGAAGRRGPSVADANALYMSTIASNVLALPWGSRDRNNPANRPEPLFRTTLSPQTASTGRVSRAGSVVGNAVNAAWMFSTFRRGPGSIAGRSGEGALTKVIGLFEKLGGPLARFGALIARLSIWGALIGGVAVGANYLYKKYQDKQDIKADSFERAFSSEESRKNSLGMLDRYKSLLTEGMASGLDESAQAEYRFNRKNLLSSYAPMAGLVGNNPDLISKSNEYLQLMEEFKKMGITDIGAGTGMLEYKYTDAVDSKRQNGGVNLFNDKSYQEFLELTDSLVKGTGTLSIEWEKVNKNALNYAATVSAVKAIQEKINNSMQNQNINSALNATRFLGSENSLSFYANELDNVTSSLSEMSSTYAELKRHKDAIGEDALRNATRVSDATNGILGVKDGKDLRDKIDEGFASAKEAGSAATFANQYYDSQNSDDPVAKAKYDYARAIADSYQGDIGLKETKESINTVTDTVLKQISSLKQLEVAYVVASSGVNILDDSMKYLNTSISTAKLNATMAFGETDQIKQNGVLFREMAKQVTQYSAGLGGIANTIEAIKASSPSEDYSLGALYNPGSEGLSSKQAEVKALLEKQNEIQDSLNGSVEALRGQADAVVDLVMNTERFKSTWDSVNSRIELSKNLYGQMREMQVDAQTAPIMQQMQQKLFGEAFDSGAFARQGAESRRDSAMSQFEQITKALATYSDDSTKLNQAIAEIQGDLGGQIKNDLIDPFKSIIDNNFAAAGNKMMQASETFKEAMSKAESVLLNEKNKEVSSSGSTGEDIVDNRVSRNIAKQVASGDYGSIIDKASSLYGVDPALIKAVIQQESNFNPNAKSHAGAMGLMQLMPGTAAGLGVTNAFDPEQNIMGGTKYLSGLLKKFGGDVSKALIGYNAGPGNVDNVLGSANGEWKEPKNYVNKVTGYYAQNGGTGEVVDISKIGNKALEAKTQNDEAQAKLAARQLQEKLLDTMLSEQVNSLGTGSIQFNLSKAIRDANTKSSISGIWTDSQTGYYDSVLQARQDVANAKFDNNATLTQYRGDLSSGTYYNPATKQQEKLTEGMIASYEKNIAKLEENNRALSELGESLKQSSYFDPRNNTTEANKQIANVLEDLSSMLGTTQVGDKKWYDNLQSLNNMFASYFTLNRKVQVSQESFDNTGFGYGNLSKLKQLKLTQDLDVMFKQMTDIATELGKFGEGTNKWYVILEDAVNVQQKLVDLENKKTETSKRYFELTNKGIGSYVNSRAYSQSRDTYLAYNNTKSAIGNYQSNRGGMDQNEQLVNLQVIAESNDKVIQQMNDYRSAVVGAFQAGAISLQEYIQRLDGLRDKQDEIKKQAVQMTSEMQSGFQSALSGALKSGLQGSLDAPMDFIAGIKDQLASSVSNQMSNVVLQQSGLQNVMNGLIQNLVGSLTTNDPNKNINTFNMNDWKNQIDGALAPFLPLIEQISQSAQGIFGILKDQVYNAPSGFKIDDYVYEIAKAQDASTIGGWNTNVPRNEAGSPYPGSGNGTITLPPLPNSPYQYNPGTVTTPIDPIRGGSLNTPIVTTPYNPVKDAIQKIIDLKNAYQGGSISSSSYNSATHNLANDIRGGLSGLKDGNGNDIVKQIGDGVKDGMQVDDIVDYLSGVDLSAYDMKIGIDGVKSGVGSLANVANDKLSGILNSLSSLPSAINAKISSGGAVITPPAYMPSNGYTNGNNHNNNGGAEFVTPGKLGGSSSSGSSSSSGGGKVVGSGKYSEVVNGVEYRSDLPTKTNGGGPSAPMYYNNGKPVYHTGGFAGLMNFASPHRLKTDEVDAIMKYGEVALQPKQINSLAQSFMDGANGVGATYAGGSGSGKMDVSVSVNGGGDMAGALQEAIQVAVEQAVNAVYRNNRLDALRTTGVWRG